MYLDASLSARIHRRITHLGLDGLYMSREVSLVVPGTHTLTLGCVGVTPGGRADNSECWDAMTHPTQQCT